MCLLLLFIPIDPNLTGVLLRRNLLILLHDLVQQLFPLDLVLLLQGLLLDFQLVIHSFSLAQLLRFFFKLPSEVQHQLVAVNESFLDSNVLLLQIEQVFFGLHANLVCQIKIFGQHLVIIVEPHVVVFQGIVLDSDYGMFLVQIFMLFGQFFDFIPQHLNSLVAIFLDLVDSHQLALVDLSFFE